jgi:hypothetical protein
MERNIVISLLIFAVLAAIKITIFIHMTKNKR